MKNLKNSLLAIVAVVSVLVVIYAGWIMAILIAIFGLIFLVKKALDLFAEDAYSGNLGERRI